MSLYMYMLLKTNLGLHQAFLEHSAGLLQCLPWCPVVVVSVSSYAVLRIHS